MTTENTANGLVFTDVDENEFANGYEAAHGEIFAALHAGRTHTDECVDCPPCEVLREATRTMLRRLRESMSEAEFAIVEGLLLKGIMEEMPFDFDFS